MPKISKYQSSTTSIRYKKLTLEDSETGDLYDISIKNGKLICKAQDPMVHRENRLKNLLDE